jgi:hypothetical protein
VALTSPTGAGSSVGAVRLRTKATEFSFYMSEEELGKLDFSKCQASTAEGLYVLN